jgi:hypothetical protein
MVLAPKVMPILMLLKRSEELAESANTYLFVRGDLGI